MSDSLRDQLLKAGFKPQPKPENRGPKPQRRQAGKRGGSGRGKPSVAEMDLAKAYALRDRSEREDRERAQREAEQRAREKKERRQRLAALLDGKSLNVADADIPRHFPHQNKIRRIYVTAEQLPRLNGGELAVVQFAGRYLLVERTVASAAAEIDADALVLLCDPHEVPDDDVPPDLVW